MRALGGKLNDLGMDVAPAKSTAGDALRGRDEELFRLYYFALISYFRPLLSVSRKKDVSFDEFFAFDSTTVTLFSQVSLDYRAIVQKIETKLPTAFFLFGYGEWDKSAGLVHVDSTFVASSYPSGE